MTLEKIVVSKKSFPFWDYSALVGKTASIYSSKPKEIKFLLTELELRNSHRKNLKQFENWLYWKISESGCKNRESSVMGAFSSKKFIGIGNEPNTSQHLHPWSGSSSQNAANKIHTHETDCQRGELWRHRAIWTDLPLETRQAGTQPTPRETSADRGYRLKLSDDEPECSSVTTELSSWPAVLPGWMYEIPGSASEHSETKPRHTQLQRPGFKRSIVRSSVTQKKLVLAGGSSLDFRISNSGWAHTLQLFHH